ncbi:LOW QUALITY PROTEIN: lysosomal acid glucosylceramidase-like [Panulirus ornatus]|uniref:LOW QUALITY PROTEIN: lysosomal acid glucosylceramidase-like n=1 Tax=Panulirus ornatus TaxID=150431 RepID=UPI003A83BFAC
MEYVGIRRSTAGLMGSHEALLLCSLLLQLDLDVVSSYSGSRRASECRPRSYGSDSVVCVCDALHCDLPGPVTFPDPGHYTVVTSSREGLRFHSQTHHLDDHPAEGSVAVEVGFATPRQTILGFGGAFTDAAGMNMASLSAPAQDLLMRSYFSPAGLEYNLCRVPIAGTDFSVRPYSYDDVEGDLLLQHFALAQEDKLYKLPLILRAQELSQRPLRLVASPWSPPPWMKTIKMHNESGHVLPEMWQPWSNYLVKFVREYEGAGAVIWGLTTQNHPEPDEVIWWNTCIWTAEEMRDWIKESLGPTLEAAGLRRLKVMVGDDSRNKFCGFMRQVLSDSEAARYIDGVAFHWYTDSEYGPEILNQTHELFPDKFILYTESCTVPNMKIWKDPGEEAVLLGSWLRGEAYAVNIIEDVNHYSAGWVDWNLALDTSGGPSWAGNRVDSPIIINATADEFYKQPMFYVMGHFSKFVAPGSTVVPSRMLEPEHQDIHTAAFLHPDGPTVLVLLNTGEAAMEVSVQIESGRFLNLHLPARAIQTVLFTRQQHKIPAAAGEL